MWIAVEMCLFLIEDIAMLKIRNNLGICILDELVSECRHFGTKLT
jgi:hypothetical protein